MSTTPEKSQYTEGSNLEVVFGLLKARELIIPWEAPYERKYGDLSATCLEARWRAFTFPVNVGCMGLTGLSVLRLLKTQSLNRQWAFTAIYIQPQTLTGTKD